MGEITMLFEFRERQDIYGAIVAIGPLVIFGLHITASQAYVTVFNLCVGVSRE